MVTMCEFALERLSESAERQARHNLRSGDDVKTAQSNLGHAAAFTLDVYGHASEKMKQDSANRMEAYMRSTVYEKPQNG